MNHVTILGNVGALPEAFLWKSPSGEEIPMISFKLVDKGLPHQKPEPFSIEVHFCKEIAMNLMKYLVMDKEVLIDGHLSFKKYMTANGEMRSKHYLNADYIQFTGKE